MSPWWLLVGFAIFLIGITKSGFGSGMGLMVVPMVAIGLQHIEGYGSKAALGLLLPLLLSGDLIALYQYRKHLGIKPLKMLLPGTLIGVLIGAVLLWWLHSHASLVEALMRIEIGLESILLVGLHWYRLRRGIPPRLMPEPARGTLTGAFSAISSTLAHAAGPIIAMYLAPLKLDRKIFVGTCALYFFMLNAAKMPGYHYAGQFADISPAFALRFLPLVIAGAFAGVWLNRRMTDALFTNIVYTCTFLLGWVLIGQGICGLVAV